MTGARVEQWRDFVEKLELWALAYPIDVFPEVDMRELEDRAYSREEVWSIGSRNAAGMARHVLARVLADVRALDAAMAKGDD